MSQDLNYSQKWIDQKLPCFKVDPSNIVVLESPDEFYLQLKVIIFNKKINFSNK